MGFNGYYTGYSVNSLDVFLWVLLTAGTIGFPVVVFTICCLKQRFRIQKLEHELLYADPAKKKNLERGFLGPYAESKENLTERKPESKMPEIVVQSNAGLNNKVRFKDDILNQDSSQLPALNNNSNQEYDQNIENSEANGTDLRGLKNAVNYFGKNLANKKQNFSNRSTSSGNQPILPQLNQYVENPVQHGNPDQNIVYTSASQINPQADPATYSIASSYVQPGVQGTISQANQLVPENIYSQVVAPQNRAQSNENYSNSQQGFYDDDQPVYMNTPYNMNDQYDQYEQYDQQSYNKNNSLA